MTIIEGFKPNAQQQSKHRLAVLAYDGVVLGDLAIPLETFGRVHNDEGQACYDVRVCGASQDVLSEHLNLKIPWGLSFVARADTIIVPGIEDLEQPIPPAVLRALEECALKRRPYRVHLYGSFRSGTRWPAGRLARHHTLEGGRAIGTALSAN